MKKLLIIFLALFIFVGICTATDPSIATPFTGDLNEQVTMVRDGYDLPPLTEDEYLTSVAKLKCDDMRNREYFDHYSPDGKLVWEQWDLAPYQKAGENLATSYYTAFETVKGWQNSPKHLENLVDPAYTKVGYAVCKGKLGNYLIVQILKG